MWCLHLLMVGLLAFVAVRALADGAPHAGASLAAAVVCVLVYAVGAFAPAVRGSRGRARVWIAALCAAWLVLLVCTGDAVWVAFPLYFLQLHLLPRRTGLVVVLATTAAAVIGFAVHEGAFSPAMLIGPGLGAAVAVVVVFGYQALYRESERRRGLIEELTATRADLAAVQHTAGVLAERDRLAREIHDTLAQGFSSIQLLLHAAERALPAEPGETDLAAVADRAAARDCTASKDLSAARDYIVQARRAAGDNLTEARRFVAALTPPALDGTTIAGALERLCEATSARHRIDAAFRLAGRPTPLAKAQEVALLRVAQSALSNTVRHADAASATVTLTFEEDAVELLVADDGRGFDTASVPLPEPGTGGFGLPAMNARARELGGVLDVTSTPGGGTSVRLRIPLEDNGIEARDDR